MTVIPEINEISDELQKTKLSDGKYYTYKIEAFEEVAITPWFSYAVTYPEEIPPLADRAVTETDEIVIRPLFMSDLDEFHRLRSNQNAQKHSWTRGRADKDLEESREYLQDMQCSYDRHWYFGLFLASTNTLIGEGGLLNLGGSSVSGWPELDFVIDPAYQRRGHGMALFDAVVNTWWALPRECGRFQLHLFGVIGIEPGSPLVDCIAMYWDKENVVAEGFFAKVLRERGISVNMTGIFEDFDKREGSETQGQLKEWSGTAISNPVPFVDKDSEDEDEYEGVEEEEDRVED